MGGPLDQEGGGGAPPKQHALPTHIMQERERRGGHTKRVKGGNPPSSVRSPLTAYRRGGGTPIPRGKKGGHPPSRVRSLHTACRGGI